MGELIRQKLQLLLGPEMTCSYKT